MEHDSAARIYRSMLGMNRRNRAVAAAYGTELSVAESAAITEIFAYPGITATELSSRLILGQVGTSRLLTGMKNKGLISEVRAVTDKRKRELLVTPRGKRVFDELKQREYEPYALAFERLSPDSQAVFKDLMERFCKDFGCPEVASLPSDPPLMREIRKLSRSIGLVNSKIFGLDEFSPLEWHILAKLTCSSREVIAAELASLYGVPPNTISGVVSRLAARKLVKGAPSAGDKRAKVLNITERGRDDYNRIEQQAVRRIENGMCHFQHEEARNFAGLWERYTGEGKASEEIYLGHNYSVRRLDGESDRLRARGLIMRGRVKEELLSDIPDTVAAENSYVYGLFCGLELRAVIETSIDSDNREATLMHGIAENESDDLLAAFWNAVLHQLSFLCGVKRTYVKGRRVSKRLWGVIPHQAGSDEAAVRNSPA